MLDQLFSIGEVCISPIRFRSAACRTVVEDLRRIPGKVRTVSRGDQLGKWTVLHPGSSDRFPRADDNALVLSTVLDTTRILLLSDLGRPGQGALQKQTPDLRADIVVTGLPVRTEAVEEALLERIKPRVLIVADSEYPVLAGKQPVRHEKQASRAGRRETGAHEIQPPGVLANPDDIGPDVADQHEEWRAGRMGNTEDFRRGDEFAGIPQCHCGCEGDHITDENEEGDGGGFPVRRARQRIR